MSSIVGRLETGTARPPPAAAALRWRPHQVTSSPCAKIPRTWKPRGSTVTNFESSSKKPTIRVPLARRTSGAFVSRWITAMPPGVPFCRTRVVSMSSMEGMSALRAAPARGRIFRTSSSARACWSGRSRMILPRAGAGECRSFSIDTVWSACPLRTSPVPSPRADWAPAAAPSATATAILPTSLHVLICSNFMTRPSLSRFCCPWVSPPATGPTRDQWGGLRQGGTESRESPPLVFPPKDGPDQAPDPGLPAWSPPSRGPARPASDQELRDPLVQPLVGAAVQILDRLDARAAEDHPDPLPVGFLVIPEEDHIAVIGGLELAQVEVDQLLHLAPSEGLGGRRIRGRNDHPGQVLRLAVRAHALLAGRVALLGVHVLEPVLDLVVGDLREPLEDARRGVHLEIVEPLRGDDHGLLEHVLGVHPGPLCGGDLDVEDAPQARDVAGDELVHRPVVALLALPDELHRLRRVDAAGERCVPLLAGTGHGCSRIRRSARERDPASGGPREA